MGQPGSRQRPRVPPKSAYTQRQLPVTPIRAMAADEREPHPFRVRQSQTYAIDRALCLTSAFDRFLFSERDFLPHSVGRAANFLRSELDAVARTQARSDCPFSGCSFD